MTNEGAVRQRCAYNSEVHLHIVHTVLPMPVEGGRGGGRKEGVLNCGHAAAVPEYRGKQCNAGGAGGADRNFKNVKGCISEGIPVFKLKRVVRRRNQPQTILLHQYLLVLVRLVQYGRSHALPTWLPNYS